MSKSLITQNLSPTLGRFENWIIQRILRKLVFNRQVGWLFHRIYNEHKRQCYEDNMFDHRSYLTEHFCKMLEDKEEETLRNVPKPL